MKTVLAVLLCLAGSGVVGQEVRLGPAPAGTVGEWAQAVVPRRMRATPAQDVRFDGPALVLSQWGEITLGTARYAFLLGVGADGRADLWVDANRDQRLSAAELVAGTRAAKYTEWRVELRATPAAGDEFPYPLAVVWPEGRGYVYLLGGAPRSGELAVNGTRARLVIVDADLDGVYGTKGDFYAVDTDGDDVIHGDPDGHERFGLDEAFTIAEKSYRLSQIDPGGAWVKLARTGYVPGKPPLIPGHPAPEFRFTTFPDGKPLALSDLRGKVVLLDFWATWCGPCMEKLPLLLELYKEHRDKGFEIVGLSLDTSERDLRAVLSARGVSWPVAFDGKSWDNPLARLYRVYQIPTSYLIDRDGIIRYRDLRGEELAGKLVELLGRPRAAEVGPVAPVETVTGPARPILEIRVPSAVALAPGEAGVFVVTLVNTSPYAAEEVRVSVRGVPGGVNGRAVEVGTIPPFGEREARVEVESAGDEPPPLGAVEVVYNYCIGDVCFQIQDRAEVAFALGGRSRSVPVRRLWWLLVPIGVGVVLAVVLRGRALAAVGLALVGLSVASLVTGLLRGQGTQARRIASTLCTSCVGIDEVRPEAPTLSATQAAALAGFTRSAELVLFHTAWCKSCPYAKALVAEAARVNPRIRYTLVDADQDRARAEAAGIVQSGRVVVPAILVVETGRVLFGTADLAARLLAALGEIR